jgi:hypothetical protein
MNTSSVFESDFLTNDSLVPTFVFYRGSQRLTRLHQTSIEIDWIAKKVLWQSAYHHSMVSEYISVPLSRRNQCDRLGCQRQTIQLGRHSGKGQNTIIVWQKICILGWSWKAPPINANELRIYGSTLWSRSCYVPHMVYQEVQFHSRDLS